MAMVALARLRSRDRLRHADPDLAEVRCCPVPARSLRVVDLPHPGRAEDTVIVGAMGEVDPLEDLHPLRSSWSGSSVSGAGHRPNLTS